MGEKRVDAALRFGIAEAEAEFPVLLGDGVETANLRGLDELRIVSGKPEPSPDHIAGVHEGRRRNQHHQSPAQDFAYLFHRGLEARS